MLEDQDENRLIDRRKTHVRFAGFLTAITEGHLRIAKLFDLLGEHDAADLYGSSAERSGVAANYHKTRRIEINAELRKRR